MADCEKYLDNIEKISLLADGELPEAEALELRSHIASCHDCQLVYDAFMGVSEAVSGDMADPPETLAAGIMYKISLQKGRGKSNIRRFAWGRYTAVAAIFVVVIFAASRMGLFPGVSKSAAGAPQSASSVALMDLPAGGADQGMSFSYSMDRSQSSEESELADAAPAEEADAAPAEEADAVPPEAAPAPEPDAAMEPEGKYDACPTAAPGDVASGDSSGLMSSNGLEPMAVTAPGDIGLTFISASLLGVDGSTLEIENSDVLTAIYTDALAVSDGGPVYPDREPDYTLTVLDSDGAEWIYYLWLDGDALWWRDEYATEATVSPMSAGDFLKLFD